MIFFGGSFATGTYMSECANHTQPMRGEFENIALPYLDEVYSAAIRLVRNAEQAEDLVVRVVDKSRHLYGGLKSTEGVRVWIYRHLVEFAFLEDRQKEDVLFQSQNNEPDINSDFSLYHQLLNNRIDRKSAPSISMVEVLTEENVRNALSFLPAPLRSIVVLCDFQELTHAETGEALRMPVESVRTMLRHGRHMFQKALWDEYTGTVGKNPLAFEK